MSASTPAAPLRLAASILFVRDGATGLEVLMVVRSHKVDFAANALVFPGGKLTPFDQTLADSWPDHGLLNSLHRSLAAAAIREAFEETGILLAQDRQGDHPGLEMLEQMLAQRPALLQDEAVFADLLAQFELRAAFRSIHRFAHIITPRMSPKRFDTHFYIAPVPVPHLLHPDMGEIVDAHWITPADALAMNHAHVLMLPTRLVLSRLAPHATVADAIADAASFDPDPIEPEPVTKEGVAGLITPALRGFPPLWQSMDEVWAESVGARLHKMPNDS